MEQYKGEAKSYEDAKLRAITAVLAASLGVEIKDDMGKITITQRGVKIATIEVSI